MITISLCIIANDERESFRETLNSIRDIVDEIVIVHTKDKEEIELVREAYGAILYEYECNNNLAEMKNYLFSKASKEYILWLNNGEVLNEASRKELKYIKKYAHHKENTFLMKKVFDEAEDGTLIKFVVEPRLVKNTKDLFWEGKVYESLIFLKEGLVNTEIRVKGSSKEKSYLKNVELIKEEKNIEIKELNHKELYYYARDLGKAQYKEEEIKIYRKIIEEPSCYKEYKSLSSLNLAEYHLNKNEFSEFRAYLFMSYEISNIKTKAHYLMGEYLVKLHKFKEAVYWYEQCRVLEEKEDIGLTIDYSYKTWLSLVKLCDLYIREGNYEKIREYNFLLENYLRNSPIIKYNKKYLNKQNFYLGEYI